MPGSTPTPEAELERRARAWIEADPDPETRAELASLLERATVDPGAAADLAERFEKPLRFGTAGMRGPMGAGPGRMNRLVVRQASAALAGELGPGATVVVGHDARHRSERFAYEATTVLSAGGLRTLQLGAPVPTPVVAFAVRHHGAEGAVMITASHNPAGENGYKVYGRDGAQLLPSAEGPVAAAIGDLDRPIPTGGAGGEVSDLGAGLVDVYVDWAAGTVASGPRELRAVYTPLHGVGRSVLEAVFERAGFAVPTSVAEQADPDPAFPTISHPNPEEPGAMELALEQAARLGADLVLANDPDADRLGVAVPEGDRWRILTGDEVGILLADHVLSTTGGVDRLVVTTFVSSPILRRMADAAAVHYEETLTGFRWIVRPGLERRDLRFVFGYEEALGYSVAEYVRDKDGITAALAFAALTAALRADGRRPVDRLEELARLHGLPASRSWSHRESGPGARERIAALISAVRAAPPSELGTRSVVGVVDYSPGADGLPSADALRLDLEGGGRVVLRPSGTETKLKAYLDVVVPVVDEPGAYREARALAEGALDELEAATRARLGLA